MSLLVHNSVVADRQPATIPAERLDCRLCGPEDSAAVLDCWRELDDRIGNGGITTSAVWVEAWLEHYGDLVRFQFFVAEQAGRPVGIALLTESSQRLGPFRCNSLHLGTAGEPDEESVCVEYNRLLVEIAHRDEFIARLAEVVGRNGRWDQLNFDGFSVEDAERLLDAFSTERGTRNAERGTKASSLRAPRSEFRARPTWFFDFKRSRIAGTDVLSQLGKSTRSNIRRQLRKLDGATVEWADSLADAESIFTELIDLHQARWQAEGKPGAFASRRFEAFQTDLIAQLLPLQRVVLFRVRSHGRTVGCLYLLVDGNRLLDYVSGFASFDQSISPGLVTHALCMQEALDRGYDAYDFLVGEHRHKQNLSTDTGKLVWATYRRPRMKFCATDALRALRRIAAGAAKRATTAASVLSSCYLVPKLRLGTHVLEALLPDPREAERREQAVPNNAAYREAGEHVGEAELPRRSGDSEDSR